MVHLPVLFYLTSGIGYTTCTGEVLAWNLFVVLRGFPQTFQAKFSQLSSIFLSTHHSWSYFNFIWRCIISAVERASL